MKVIYKITYPNGKLYIGKDLTDTLSYFGSPDSRSIEKDFSGDQRRDFTIRKQILWESQTASDADVNAKEIEYIKALKSNDPSVGYNRLPPVSATPAGASTGGHSAPSAQRQMPTRQAGEVRAGAGGSANPGSGGMRPDFKPGSVVLHRDFGAGTIVSKDGDRIGVDFKLRGRKNLVASIAAELMTVTGFKQLAQPGHASTKAVSSADVSKKADRKAKKKTKAKAAKGKKKKGAKAKARKKALQYGTHAGRAGGERWEWDMTTPNTPLYRKGRS